MTTLVQDDLPTISSSELATFTPAVDSPQLPPTSPQMSSTAKNQLEVVQTEPHCFAIGEHTDLWLAVLSGTGEIVVLKEMRGSFVTKRPELRHQISEHLVQYIQDLQDIEHPNIGRIIGLTYRDDLAACLVLPLLRNGDVVNYSKNNPDQTNRAKIKLAKDLVAGLAYLHKHNVVHGKVHERNVLVNDNGSAVLSDAKLEAVTLTDGGYRSIPATCWWMAPEQLLPEPGTDIVAPASMSADVYSAALTITQLWTGRRPFSRIRNHYALITTLQKLVASNIPRIERPDELVPVHVWAVLEDCLSIDPQARPTVGILLARLEGM